MNKPFALLHHYQLKEGLMANRRMFSKDLTESDRFTDMPIGSQALYFHLGMSADDDGFVSPNRVSRMVGAQPDDLKVLLAKEFVIPFNSGVIVIRHWKNNNYIQSDRYTPTSYHAEFNTLYVDEMGRYTLEENKLYTKCIHSGNTGKDRIGKVSKDMTYTEGVKPIRGKGSMDDGTKERVVTVKAGSEFQGRDMDEILAGITF